MHLIRYISMSDDNQLTVIEKKPERCREVSNVSDATILNEDGSKPDIHKKAEASQTDLLLVATSDDRANITATRHAKKEFGVPRIISVANSPKNKQRLTEAGADIVVCPVELALRDLENLLAQDRSTTLIYRPEPELELKSGDRVLLLGDAPSVARTVELLRSDETA